MKDITAELRIGNYVTMNGEPLGVDVSNVPVKMDAKLFHAAIYGFKGYWPVAIPLTEEWLLKFGFDTRHQTNLFMKTDNLGDFTFTFLKLDSGLIPGICHRMNIDNPLYMGPGNKKIKYVHQLQNLYFALTGSELILQK